MTQRGEALRQAAIYTSYRHGGSREGVEHRIVVPTVWSSPAAGDGGSARGAGDPRMGSLGPRTDSLASCHGGCVGGIQDL